jgi:hypothetical protein
MSASVIDWGLLDRAVQSARQFPVQRRATGTVRLFDPFLIFGAVLI